MRLLPPGLTLVAALTTLGVAAPASANKFTHQADLQIDVKLTERTRPPAGKRDAPAAPEITASEVLHIQGLLGAIESHKIAVLEDLIRQTPDSEVDEKADLLYRLGNIHAKQHRYHRLKTVETELAAAKASGAQKGTLSRQLAEHRAQAKDALLAAIGVYKKLVDNPSYVNAPAIDTALFYYAYTLQHAGYLKEAREAYDTLLARYPRSKYVPEAHLAFADHYFETQKLADAEARYRQVLKFPASSVFHYAQYKLGWVAFNLGKFADAMQAFHDVAEATKGKADRSVLHRAAKHDFVRAYAEIGKADKALLAFRRVAPGSALEMLAILADLYFDQGKTDKAVFAYRQLMTEAPKSPSVCVWEHNVARAMLSAGAHGDRVREIEQLVKLATTVKLPAAEAQECRAAAAEMSGQLARAYHQEGHKTKNAELLGHAGRLYRAYLGAFPDAPDYGETAYYHAELAWLYAELETRDRRLATLRWEDAAEAFTGVLRRGKLPPHLVQTSADAAMLAWMKALAVDPRVAAEALDDDTAYTVIPKPKALPPREGKLLGAYDLYLAHVKGDVSERVDVLFHKGRLLRKHDHLEPAIAIFESIVAKHPDHETAEWSAQLVLDSYNRLQRYDAMLAFARGLPAPMLAAHPELKKTVDKLALQAVAKEAEALSREAKRTGAHETYVACGNKYLEAYNRDPLADNGDVLLYNAGLCYEEGRSLSAAMGMYKTLQQHFGSSKLAARSLARLGNVFASIAFYREAAEKLEEYATKYGGEADAFPALSDAVQFRKGVGDDARAIADTEKFIAMFGAKRPAEAAAAHFSMIGIYEKQGDLDKLARHLRAYLDRYKATGGADRRIIASAKLGQALWQAACPVPTVDGACVRAPRVVAIPKKLRLARTVPERCDDAPSATTVARDERKVKAAMEAFDAAIADYERTKPTTGDARGALYHYALARFGKLEREYERFLAMPIPGNLDFDPRKPAIAAQSRKRFETWFLGKRDLGIAMRKQYEALIDLKDGAIAIASAARLGAIMQNFAAQLFRAEIPKSQRTGPYAEETSEVYCDELTKLAEPLQADAENAFEGCLVTSTRLGWFSEWSRACERELGQLRPETYPQAFELRAAPHAVARIVDVEGAARL